MPFRSRYPDAEIPAISLTAFVLGAPDGHENRPALVDGTSGHKLTFGEVRR